MLALASYGEWRRNEQSLRQGDPIPYRTRLSRLLAWGVALVAVGIAVLAIVDLLVQRSALAMAGTAALMTKAGAEGGSLTVGLLGGGVIFGAALAVWAYTVALSRRAREDRAVPSGARANLGITVASVGTGVVALMVVLLG